jgi:hypothetical protein
MIDFTSPNTIAFLQFIGLGFLCVVAAFGQWFGRRKESAPPASKDVFIPSLSIADNQVIADATGTLKEANLHIRDRKNLDREMLFHMKLQTEHLEDIKHCLQGLNKMLRARRPKRRG